MSPKFRFYFYVSISTISASALIIEIKYFQIKFQLKFYFIRSKFILFLTVDIDIHDSYLEIAMLCLFWQNDYKPGVTSEKLMHPMTYFVLIKLN